MEVDGKNVGIDRLDVGRSGDSDDYVVQQLMYVPYGMYKRVAVVTHVSDEKSIKTEHGDGKLKIQVKHTFVLNFFSLSSSFSPRSGATLTHTLSLSCLCIPAALPNPHYKQKLPFWWENKKAESSYWRRNMIRKKKLKINIVHTATTEQLIR